MGLTMPVRSNLRLLLAQANVERARRGQPPLSLRQLALETGISASVIAALAADRSQRIDYGTIDRLLRYLNTFLAIGTGDLLVWEPEQGAHETDGPRGTPESSAGSQ